MVFKDQLCIYFTFLLLLHCTYSNSDDRDITSYFESRHKCMTQTTVNILKGKRSLPSVTWCRVIHASNSFVSNWLSNIGWCMRGSVQLSKFWKPPQHQRPYSGSPTNFQKVDWKTWLQHPSNHLEDDPLKAQHLSSQILSAWGREPNKLRVFALYILMISKL